MNPATPYYGRSLAQAWALGMVEGLGHCINTEGGTCVRCGDTLEAIQERIGHSVPGQLLWGELRCAGEPT